MQWDEILDPKVAFSGWAWWPIALCSFVVAIYLWRVKNIREDLQPTNKKSRQKIIERLSASRRRDKLQRGYHTGLSASLEWSEGKIGPSWSAKAFLWSWNMALLYPLMLVFVIWLVTGQNISGIEGFLSESVFWKRFAQFVGLIVICVSVYYSNNFDGWKSWLAVAVAFAGAGAFAVAVAVAGAGAVAGVGVGAVAFAVAGAVAGAVVGVGVGAVAFAVAGAVAGASIWFIGKERYRFFFALALFYLCITFAMIFLGAGNEGWKVGIAGGVLTFFVLIPVINAFFDWASISITRGLLGKSINKGAKEAVLWSCIDFVLALVCLCLLILTLCVLLSLFNAAAIAGGGVMQFDLNGLLQGIQKNPGAVQYWWIYGMVFSTLLPTFIHFGVFLSALIVFIPSRTQCEEMLQTIQDVDNWDTGEERRMAQILAWPWPIGALGALLSAGGLVYVLGYFMEQWHGLALWGSRIFGG